MFKFVTRCDYVGLKGTKVHLNGQVYKLGRVLGKGSCRTVYNALELCPVRKRWVTTDYVIKYGVKDDNYREHTLWNWASTDIRKYLAACIDLSECHALVMFEKVQPLGDNHTRNYDVLWGYHDEDCVKAEIPAFLRYDWHDGNVGLTKDGRWVMLDYSMSVEFTKERMDDYGLAV